MRVLEPWVAEPLAVFLEESSARVVLLMTASGQVVAQHGFTRALDVMAAAALGAGILASTEELARVMALPPFGAMSHQGREQGLFLAGFQTPRGRWIGLVVFGRDSSLGLVQVFFDQMVAGLVAAAPTESAREPVLATDFEQELNDSLRTMFGR